MDPGFLHCLPVSFDLDTVRLKDLGSPREQEEAENKQSPDLPVISASPRMTSLLVWRESFCWCSNVIFKYMTQNRTSILVDKEWSSLSQAEFLMSSETPRSFIIMWNVKTQVPSLGVRGGLGSLITLFLAEKPRRAFLQDIFPHHLCAESSVLCQALGTWDVNGADTVLSFMMLRSGWFPGVYGWFSGVYGAPISCRFTEIHAYDEDDINNHWPLWPSVSRIIYMIT